MKRVRKALKKYFVPHEENDHKPHILRPRTVAFVLVIALAVEGALMFGASYVAPNSKLFGIIVVNDLIDGTNQNRVENNVPALTVSPLLTVAAQEKADDMVANNYFAHTSPSGLTPWYWFEQVGYNFQYAGENLAVNFSDSDDVTNAWMNSPEHRANILNVNFTQIGIATATGTFEGHSAVYVVELFGDPTLAAPPGDSVPFVNSAAAATPSAAPVTTSAKTASVKKTAPVAIVASSGSQTATSAEMFMAVQGAISTSDVSTTATSTTSTTALAPGVGVVAGAGTVVPAESNPVQSAAANPRQLVDYLYLAVIVLFSLALAINVFVKVRIQHAQVIFGGMLIILVAGLLIVLNQHVLGGAVIL